MVHVGRVRVLRRWFENYPVVFPAIADKTRRPTIEGGM